jgi:parallel beta-helix repeat protein
VTVALVVTGLLWLGCARDQGNLTAPGSQQPSRSGQATSEDDHAKDLFYTTSGAGTGAPNGAELFAIEVRGSEITTTDIGSTMGGDCASLALSPSGTLFSMCGPLFGNQQLATINPKTRRANLFGVTVSGLSVMAMAFAPDGTLYAVGDCNPDANFECNTSSSPPDPNYNSLYTVNVITGAFTRLGSTHAPQFFMDLAFDREGHMFGVTTTDNPSTVPAILYRIDPATGAATKIINLVGSNSVMGLAFGREGKLYATDFAQNPRLYLIDIKTGFETAIAALPFGFSSGLELAPEQQLQLEDKDQRALVVSNNRERCPHAEFGTIQDAVNAASAGDKILVCPGVYQEMVTVSGAAKNNLQIWARAELGSVAIDGMDHSLMAGFLLQQVSGVVIHGFTVREFHEADIWLQHADHNFVRDNVLTAAGHDGIELTSSSWNLIEHNRSFDNPASNACGVNIAGSGSRGNVVRHNLLRNNNWGIQVVAGAVNNIVFGNESVANRNRGIRSVGSTGTVIDQNRTERNPIGIAVVSSTGVQVARNRSFDNTIFDLFWDGTGAVSFTENHCDTSSPDGLCAP